MEDLGGNSTEPRCLLAIASSSSAHRRAVAAAAPISPARLIRVTAGAAGDIFPDRTATAWMSARRDDTVLGGPLPPMPAPDVVWRRMRRLAAQATVAVHTQHLVSGVLLGQFAAPIGQRGAPQVYSLNLEHPHTKLTGRGLDTCGSAPVKDFVRFESGSLEKVWAQVENRAAAEFSAVRDGGAVQPGHLDWLRDLIAIHHARSIQYYAVFEDSLENADELARRYWQYYPHVLDAIAALRLSLPAGETGSRERAVQDFIVP